MTERLAVWIGGLALALVVSITAATFVHDTFTKATAQVECIRDPSTCPVAP